MQRALTVIARIKPDRAAELEKMLFMIGQDIRGTRDNRLLLFDKLTRVHFARFVLIPNVQTGAKEFLIFESNYDDPLRQHLDEMVDQAGEAMEKIWSCCEGFPNVGHTDGRFKRAFRGFINRHSYDYGAFHRGYRFDTVKQVKQYAVVRDLISQFLNLPDVQKLVDGKLRELFDALPVTVRRFERLRKFGNNVFIALKLVVFFIELFLRLFNVYLLRPLKNAILRREPALNIQVSDDKIEEGVDDIEDVVTQNQLTVLTKIKPGALWKLKFTLCFVNVISKYWAVDGTLSGLTTIHFARWLIIDRGRYLLFHSNYDGSWASYIGDFVDKASVGMDNIWRSAPNYPEKGSVDIEAFKLVIRRNQLKTQVFYSAYPDRTVVNIQNDRAIARTLNRQGVTDWLRRL